VNHNGHKDHKGRAAFPLLCDLRGSWADPAGPQV